MNTPPSDVAADVRLIAPPSPSLPESFRSVGIPGRSRFWRKLLAFSGPGFLVAVGYMDPGNWATDLAGGSKFGYGLLPVIVLSSLAAIFLQWLALRLGIVTGLDLAQACRARFGKWTNRLLWVTCELAIIACNLAEVLGTAIALNMLFRLPVPIGVALTALDTFVILLLQKRGFRYLEALVITLMAMIAGCFIFQMIASRPELGGILASFKPERSLLTDRSALYIAIGIFGATVMPHNLYLHSSVVQTRKFDRTPNGRKEAIRFSTIDCIFALSLAMLVNAAILIMAAAVFNRAGMSEVAELQDAHKLLSPLLGTSAAGILFALSLLAAGQNSTLTGTLAGQIVMEGFLQLKVSVLKRRLITRALAILPAIAVTMAAGDAGAGQLLIFSQVVLSLQLGFAVIPLVMFTSDRQLMGGFTNRPMVVVVGTVLATAIVAVNLWLVYRTFTA